MTWLTENWPIIAAMIPALLTVLWGVAQLTPWTWDNKAVAVARQLWGMVPVGERDPDKMGRSGP